MTKRPTRSIEVFRPGTFKPMAGDPITFSAEDLAAIAAAYDAHSAPAPAVIGHPKTDDPAFAWAASFRYDAEGARLLAELDEIEPSFADAVAAGRYKKISLSLFAPDAPNNPRPGGWYPKHIGFLGAAAPAVPGLKPVSFAADGAGVVTFEFADASALRDVAGLFRSLREFLIEKFGSETADKALPNWSIGWIDDAADRDPPERLYRPDFAAPPSLPPKTVPAKEPTMSDNPDLAARLADVEKRERTLRHQENLAFAEGLVAEGKLLPAIRDKAVALMDELAAKPTSVSFADGSAAGDAAQLLRDLLSAQPKIVSFGAVDIGDAPEAGVVSFALPDGARADEASLAIHRKAIAFQAKNPSVTYMAAVAAVQS